MKKLHFSKKDFVNIENIYARMIKEYMIRQIFGKLSGK